jgi:hypothetical protein
MPLAIHRNAYVNIRDVMEVEVFAFHFVARVRNLDTYVANS